MKNTDVLYCLMLILASILLGLVPAVMAKIKGRNFFRWWIFGTLLFYVAVFIALLMNPKGQSAEQEKVPLGVALRSEFDFNEHPGRILFLVLAAMIIGFLFVNWLVGGGSGIPGGPATPRVMPTPPLR